MDLDDEIPNQSSQRNVQKLGEEIQSHFLLPVAVTLHKKFLIPAFQDLS